MSSLINNLNEIYETKLAIKEILNTDEEVFSYYPDLIEAAIASGGATGTIDITTNGTHAVSTYAYAYVNVPQQEVPVVPPGYTYVYGGKEIITNGNNIDIASYSYINVSVPAPEGWLYPSGYAYITTNGDFDIRAFDSVNVAVPQSGLTWDEVASYGYVFPTGTYAISSNGLYHINYFAYVDVDVQGGAAVLGYTTITTNGTTYASSFDLDGFSYVEVDVPIDWAYVAACGYTYTGGGAQTITWSDILEINQQTGNPEYVGPEDETVVEMTGETINVASILGSNEVAAVANTLSQYGATDAANHLSNIGTGYLTAFNYNDGTGFINMYIVTDEVISDGQSITVTGPIYDLCPYQQGGLWWWTEIDATDIVVNS